MAKFDKRVDLYEDGGYSTAIWFRRKWEAWLFHILLNRSEFHAGVRYY